MTKVVLRLPSNFARNELGRGIGTRWEGRASGAGKAATSGGPRDVDIARWIKRQSKSRVTRGT